MGTPEIEEAKLSAARHGPKAPRESAVTLSQLMEIRHANTRGSIHGGEIMKLIDTAAGIAASRHAGGPVVTVSLDQMSFLHPVRVGNVVFVHASVNDVGRTSMEVGVRVEAEDLVSGSRTHTSSAYLVFVALDGDGRPRPARWGRGLADDGRGSGAGGVRGTPGGCPGGSGGVRGTPGGCPGGSGGVRGTPGPAGRAGRGPGAGRGCARPAGAVRRR